MYLTVIRLNAAKGLGSRHGSTKKDKEQEEIKK
jgi:hypothetical protein